jgi:NAD(P)-dependent dehydrogenase (short-subunit alcohol dehydrogenase family)
MNLFSVSGRKALVVGGTRGIGRAIAWRLAVAGAVVVSTYVRDDQAATQFSEEARHAGLSLDVVRGDVTNAKGIELVIEKAATLDPLSILVFAAATGVHKSLEQLTTRHMDWTFGLNVRAFFELVQRISPRMTFGSSIVALSSEGAVRAIPHYSLVGASKGALESLARHMAAELAPKGIRVNVLSPGTVLTDAWKVLPDADVRLAEASHRSFLGRLTTVDEVAWAAQFLCSDAASGLVGHTLVVDGGARIRG